MFKAKNLILKRGGALLLAALLLVLTPLAVLPAKAANAPILLDKLEITLNGTTYTPVQSVSGNHVTYTVDGTADKTGLNYDVSSKLFLSFITKRNNAQVNIVYPPYLAAADGIDDGNWLKNTARPNGTELSLIHYTYSSSDENYYLYHFRFYAGNPGAYNPNDYTDYTIRLKKRKIPAFVNVFYAGSKQYSSAAFKEVPGKDYREFVIAENVTFPYTTYIKIVPHYLVTGYIDGKVFLDVNENHTFTAAKPYLEFTIVPGKNADTNDYHYVTGKWRITVKGKAAATKSIAEATVSSISNKQYTGSQIKPVPAVTYSGTALTSGTHYTVKYGTNKAIGKGTVTITGKGSYSGSKTITFNIVPKKTSVSKITVGKKQAKVYWKKVSSAQKVTKYQIRYRKKGTTAWKTKTVSASSSSATIKSLTKKKTYQFQVRSYKTVSGVKYYSSWSAAKTSKKIK